MSALEGISELLEEAEKVAEGGTRTTEEMIDDIVAKGADGQAAEFQAAGVKPEFDAAGKPVEGKDPAQAMKEGAGEIAADAKAGKSLVERLKDAKKMMWDNKWKFAKVVGMEVGKGALFTAGMEAVEGIWDAAFKSDPSPTNDTRLKIIQACNKAGDIIDPIITEWRG
jgi:hypothetical protein